MSPSKDAADAGRADDATSIDHDVARFEQAAAEAFAAMERVLASSASAKVSDIAVQQILTAGTRMFARKIDEEQRYFLPITERHAVTATDAAVLATELLPAVDLNVFDLSLWASRPRDDGS